MRDVGVRRRLVDNARRDVRERFTWEIVLPKYLSVLGVNPHPGPLPAYRERE